MKMTMHIDETILAEVMAKYGFETKTDAVNFALKEPKSDGKLDCHVSCVPDGGGFRLQGHASFDIVFSYGRAGLHESGAGWPSWLFPV